MLEFIAKYWLEFAFGIVALGLTGLAKYFYGLYKKAKKQQVEESHKQIVAELKEIVQTEHDNSAKLHADTLRLFTEEREISKFDDDEIKASVSRLDEKISTVQHGVLSIQGKQFKDDCRYLLRDDHTITLDEYEVIEADHETYNSLGGNHQGDKLFQMVENKFKNSLYNNGK